MKLTLVERLLLVNQYTILEHLRPSERDTYSRIRQAIEQGYQSEYKQALGWINENEMHEHDTGFVQNVLGMYLSLGYAYEDAPDKTKFKDGRPTFLGFDETNEPEFFGYATYLIEQPARYDTLKSPRGYNSHHPVTQKYLQMLSSYQQSSNPEKLTVEDVNRIMAY